MDSSIRPSVTKGLLGGLSWKPEEVRPAEWEHIILHILQEHAGCIEYLPGYKPIKLLVVEQKAYHHDYQYTDLSRVTTQEGVSLDTKCFYLTSLSHKVEGDAREMHHLGYGCRFVYEQKLYLTNKGCLLLSDRKYERVFESRTDKPGRVNVTETTCSWVFAPCESAKLTMLLDSKTALAILDSLGTQVASGVKERRARLERMEEVLADLKGISGRLDHYGSWQHT